MKNISRRDVLRACMLSSSLALLGGGYALINTAVASSNQNNWQTVESKDLEPMIGDNFYIYGEQSGCTVTLSSVWAGKFDPDRLQEFPRKQSFVAIFSPIDGYDCLVNDQIAQFVHPEIIGEDSLFIMVKKNEQGEVFYEVVFG